jgi:hypothetical protein
MRRLRVTKDRLRRERKQQQESKGDRTTKKHGETERLQRDNPEII